MVKKIESTLMRMLQGIKIIDTYISPEGLIKIKFDKDLESSDYIILENLGWYLKDGYMIFEIDL